MGKNSGICTKCKGEHTGNHASYCKACFNSYQRSKLDVYREKKNAANRVLTRKNPEKYAEKMRKMRASNPEKYRAYRIEYQKNNPDRVRAWDRKKRLKRKRVGDTPIKRRDWAVICDAYGNRCFYCGASECKLTIDHAIPLSRGGTHVVENLRPACRRCNGEKWARTPEEYYEYRKNRLGQRIDIGDTVARIEVGSPTLAT